MLSPRAATILRALVSDYIETATPVASEGIVRKFGLKVSPATVRNEMARLEEEGYITRPHISAGGVPSYRGYRFYVETLPEPEEPPPEVKRQVRQRFIGAGRDLEAWTRLAASLLAQMAGNLALVTLPKAVRARLRHIELVYLQEFLALLIVILQEARLHQQLMPLKESVTQEELTRVSNKLNALFSGLTPMEIRAKQVELSPLEAEVRENALAILERDEETTVDHYVDGLRLLLSQPEFSGGRRARDVVEMLEERALLKGIMAAGPQEEGVKVVIGEENEEEALKPFSVVLCHYGLPGETIGLMGVVGPTRMDYATTIGRVRFLSLFMSQLVASIHGRGV
jgi:heat-inducible transcriptional repressor